MSRRARTARGVALAALGLFIAVAPAAEDLSKGRPPLVLDARIGPNLRLGDDPSLLPSTQRGQAEPHLVRSATDPNLLLATFQEGRFEDAGAVTCGYAVSRDGGLTWRRALIPNLVALNGGRFNRATDPVAGAGPQGELYLQNLVSVAGAFNLAAVVVSRSLDGGDTWSLPQTVFESTVATTFPDKNWLAVNEYSALPTAGRLVSTWTSFLRNAAGATLSANLVASVSDDRGTTWSPPVNVTPVNSLNQGSQPVFLPDGSLGLVYVTFLNPANVTTIAIEYKRSPDGGRTFPATATSIVPRLEAWDDPQLRDGVFLPAATVARSAGTLFVTYAALAAGTPRIFVTHSTDSGASWSAPIIVSDQPAGGSVMNPAIAASPDGRTVAVVFMDKRDAPGGRDFVDTYAALSFDGGLTWQPNLRVSEQSSELRYGPATARGVMLGDYFAVVPSADSAQPWVAVWCDTRTGDSDPFVARFAPLPAPSFDAWRIARFRPEDHGPGGRSSAAGDPDGDGLANLHEYWLGREPLVADSGDPFVVERIAEDTYSIAWAQRPGLTEGPVLLSPDSPVPRPPPAGGRLPDVSAPAGLEWRTTGIRGRTPAALALAGVSDSDGLAGTRYPPVVVTGPGTSFANDTRLVNLSTRAATGEGSSPLIAGFVLDGQKNILVRAAGPALASLGVRNALLDPHLALTSADSSLSAVNPNWSAGGATAGLFNRVGAFPFAAGSLDRALVQNLGAQGYSVVVSAPQQPKGVALVEVYDTDPRTEAIRGPRIVNLSTRGEAGTDADAMIAGFVLAGSEPHRVLIRAVGPGLAAFGLPGLLADPQLEVYRGSTPIARNDDWERGRGAGAVAATARLTGAFALPRGSLDAALLLTLAPGAYTVAITGAAGQAGLALVEIYDVE